MLNLADYQLADPSKLITPCLLVYPDIIRDNLRESLRIAGGPDRLRPHVKTHKSPDIVRLAIELGITKHKCATLSEARMLAQCGVPDVLIAYQQVGPAIARLLEIVADFPETRFSTVVDEPSMASDLEQQVAVRQLSLDVLIDIDAGMHRTGMPPGKKALELYGQLSLASSLRPVGLHVYDGHNHQTSLSERQAAVASEMQPVLDLVSKLTAAGHAVEKLVCGGTPTFPVFAQFELGDIPTSIECSPGTCVLSDFGYGNAYRDMSGIQQAAVLMTRVISKHHQNLLTLDLGHKAVAGDPPAGKRCYFLSEPQAREVKHNEEHLVIETNAADQFCVGDVLYALPSHICPTVALHSHLQVVRQGQVIDTWPVVARDRIYR